jgi:WD40 repeat protein
MRRLDKARERLRIRLTRRGVATVGLGAAVLAPAELSAQVPEEMVKAAIAVGNGNPVPVGVQALADGGTAVKLLHLAMGMTLLLAGGGIGWAAFLSQPTTNPQTVAAAAPSAEDRTPQAPKMSSLLDADGRPLPAGAVRRLGSRRFRIEGRNDFMLLAPDGKYILVHPHPSLSGYAAQGLMLVDAESGLRVRSFEDSRRVAKCGSLEAIRPAAFSPDGKKLYALGWHPSEKDGNGFAQWAYQDNPCKRVLLVWDVATGKRTAEWDLPSGGWLGPPPSLIGVNVSPDGKRLYVYGAIRIGSAFNRDMRGVPGVHVLDAITGKRLQTWEGAGYPVGTLAGGKELITFRREAEITALDSQTGKPVRTFPLAGYIASVALSMDGKTVAAVSIAGETGKKNCEVRLWESATAREIRRFSADIATVGPGARLVFAADGRTLYLGTASGRILRWDLTNGQSLPDWPAHNGRVADLFLRPGMNELVSAGSNDGAIRRWDVNTGKCLSATDAYVGKIAVVRTPDGKRTIAVDEDGRLDVWDVATGRVTKTLRTPGRQWHETLFTPDGKQLLIAAQTGPNTIWDLSTGKQVGEFAPPPKLDPKADEYYWGALCFSPDGRRLAASKFGRGTWMWEWPEKKILWHEAREWECHAFPDADTLVGGDWNHPFEIRDARTGAVRRTIPSRGLAHVTYSHDRTRIVTAHLDGTWCVRDAVTAAVLKGIKGFQYVWNVAFSPSGWLLAVAGDNSVRVYDTASWQEVARFDGHDGTVDNVFFGRDDATLISASGEDGTILVWSLKPPRGDPPDPTKLWADLAGNGPTVRQAVWAAAQHPDMAIKLFRQKWPAPEQPVDAARMRKRIGELDSTAFAEREAAQAELAKLGRQAETELRKALAETQSLEVKRRAEALLGRWSPPAAAEYSPDDARELRAVWALELAGTPEAKQLLEVWAKAKVGNRLCEEADDALKRRK